ncbi:MAG: DUF2249 domain-containing protein [Thiogranum sp.]|nr:DUF2249 domain-containing protein [Thiogranum sp.]
MMTRKLDVRSLAAPEPLERILAELDILPRDARLEVTHWREPLLLYPLLDERGWQHSTVHDEKNGIYLISIRRPAT